MDQVGRCEGGVDVRCGGEDRIGSWYYLGDAGLGRTSWEWSLVLG